MAIGCSIHTAFIYDRGGARRLFQVDLPSSIKWGRLRDDISSATVIIRDPAKGCQEQMTNVQPNRHELVIYRGSERVWEGPITRMGWHRDFIEVEARDVMHYAYRTNMRNSHGVSGVSVSTLTRSVDVLGELSRKEALSPPINVLPYVTVYSTPNDAQTARHTGPFQSTVFQDIDSMAHRVGMDYVTVGRRILLFDTHTVWAKTPQVTEADFLGDIVVTYYGMEHATHAAVTTGDGVYASTGANDAYYGEWEILDQAYNEEGTVAPTQAALLSQAVRNLDGRNPVPLHVRVPDNSQLNPNGVLQIAHLVPGIRIPLRATLLSLEVSQMQKLDQVTVVEDGERGEAITVVMSPASQNDEEPA